MLEFAIGIGGLGLLSYIGYKVYKYYTRSDRWFRKEFDGASGEEICRCLKEQGFSE